MENVIRLNSLDNVHNSSQISIFDSFRSFVRLLICFHCNTTAFYRVTIERLVNERNSDSMDGLLHIDFSATMNFEFCICNCAETRKISIENTNNANDRAIHLTIAS